MSKQWAGFHRIERTLWQQNTTKGTGVYATKLMDDVNTLVSKVKTIQLQPAQLANGAVELMNEVANSKITGEEDRYSHTDLSDFQGNLSGSREAFDLLKPALTQTGNAQLAATIDKRFASVQQSLDRFKRNTALGFAPYGEVTQADRQTFASEVDSLDEPCPRSRPRSAARETARAAAGGAVAARAARARSRRTPQVAMILIVMLRSPS